MNNNPITGFRCFIDGINLITQPGLRRFVLIPVIINLILFVTLFLFTRHLMADFNVWLSNHLPTWLHWLNTLIWILFTISFFIFFIYTFVTLANLIAAPFNSLLAEQVEFYLTGKTIRSLSYTELLKDTPRILARQIAIIFYYIPRALFILILFLIPVIHVFAVALWLIFNAWFMALTYLDYPTDNHRIPLAQVKAEMKKQHWTCLGFGFSVLLMSMVPVLNLFAMSAAVAGATRLWVKNNT